MRRSIDNVPMTESRVRARKSSEPGLRALSCCGDGFWELDLIDGTAWFSDWFYRKLGWPLEVRRTALQELKAVLGVDGWDTFMRGFRAHLEQAIPFDVRLPVPVAGGHREWWQFRGSAVRTDAGLPLHVGGSARQLSSGEQPAAACPCGAFDALPVAAALFDAGGELLHSNSRWGDVDRGLAAMIAQKIKAAEGVTAFDFTIHPPAAAYAHPSEQTRPIRGRATRNSHEGGHYWIAVLEDR